MSLGHRDAFPGTCPPGIDGACGERWENSQGAASLRFPRIATPSTLFDTGGEVLEK